MKSDLPLTSRRTGLAGVAALFLAALSRPLAAEAGDDEALPPPCCGNGPPNVARYGTGTEAIPQPPADPVPLAGLVVEFKNPLWGRGGTRFAYAWVFVPNAAVIAISYTDPDGNQQPVISYLNPKGFKGIVFLIAPGFTLDLQWPDGQQPDFSTRPLGKDE
jgi:hypothetical protein